MIEQWKDIEGYSNYEVSSLGNVRNKIKTLWTTFIKKMFIKKSYKQ